MSNTSWVTAFYPSGSSTPKGLPVTFKPHAILREGGIHWIVAAVLDDDPRVTGFLTEDEAADLARRLGDECKSVKAK